MDRYEIDAVYKKEINIEQIHRSEHQFSVILFRITITEVQYRADKAKQT